MGLESSKIIDASLFTELDNKIYNNETKFVIVFIIKIEKDIIYYKYIY